MKMHLLGRFAVNLSFGVRNPLKNSDGFFLHPIRERTFGNQLFDFSERAVFIVVMMFVFRFAWCVFVRMRMAVVVMVAVVMIMVVIVIVMRMPVFVVMFVGQMNVKFYSSDPGFFLARNVEMITIDLQFFQLVLELMRIDAQIQQRA